jgi:hypothetical protein
MRLRQRVASFVSLTAGVICLAFVVGQAAAETVTRGETGADTTCETGTDFVAVQTGVSGGPSYRVPSGQWTITSWSAEGGSGGQEALVVFRPTGTPDEYTIVGSTSPQTLSAPQNTFNANIKVKGGDLIGFWVQTGTMCARAASSADTVGLALSPGGPPAGGATVATFVLGNGFRLNMKVTLRSSSGSGSSGSSGSETSVPEPQPARIAICTAAPIQRTDGTIGTFADVLASQYPTTDTASPYYGAAPAKYAQGLGLTCDNLPGYTDAGYTVNGDGVRAPAGQEATWPAPYEYFTKSV